MTVNTLGTDSRHDDSRPGGDPLAAGTTRRSWTENRWPLLAICIALFSISALVYYHLHRTGLEPTKLLSRLFAGIYDLVGLAPSVIFFLMVAAWGAIWLHNGVLERPLARLGRLLMMAALLGVALNLGDVDGLEQPHKGAFGAWLARRLADSIGYVPTMVLVWPATFASLMLATEWFFAEYFERLRRPGQHEIGVEAAVTDHLRGLSEAAAAASLRPAVATEPRAPVTLRAAAPAPVMDLTSAGLEDEAYAERIGAELVDEAGGPAETDSLEDEVGGDGGQRLSYAERRAARQARRAGLVDVDESLGHADEPVLPVDEALVVEVPDLAPADAVDSETFLAADDAASVVSAEAEPVADEHAATGGEATIPDEGLSDSEVFAIMASIDEGSGGVVAAAEPVEEQLSSSVGDGTVGDLAPEVAATEGEATEAGAVEEFAAERPATVSGRLDGFIRLDGEAMSSDVADEDEDEVEDLAPDAAAEAAEAAADEAPFDTVLGEVDLAEVGGQPAAQFVEESYAGAEQSHAGESVADESAVAEDLDDASEVWAGESEPSVAIPRPDVVSATPPTPPAVKQRQLFGGADEALVQEAIELVVDSRRATAALLQRKLRVDYELACELLRELASRGVVALEGDASRARVLDA